MQDELKKGMKRLAVTSLMTGAAAMGIVATERPVDAAIVDGFLRVQNIPGESQDSKHKGEINIISYSQSYGGVHEGRFDCSTIKIVKHLDSASPRLATLAATGASVPQMMLTLRKAGKDQQEFYRLDLKDVSVVETEVSMPASNIPAETVTLRMKSATIEYRPQNPNGTLGNPIKETISCPTNPPRPIR